MEFKTIVSLLQDCRLSFVSKKTGIPHNYLIKLRDGIVTDPRYSVFKKLEGYFNDRDGTE